MRMITTNEFLRWASTKAIHLDSRYPEAKALQLPTDAGSRFWVVPPEPECRPYFLSRLLDLLGDWQTCYVWRRHGAWPGVSTDGEPAPNDRVERCIFQACGVPTGGSDVLAFDRPEFDAILTLLFAATVFAWSQPDDLFVVPDHGRQLLQTDHHNVIHASFAAIADLQRWVDAMAADDYALPEEPPDATFKWPAWMSRRR